MAQFLSEFFSIGNLFTLLMLILLQAVLGFDNLLYISIESKRVEEKSQGYVRRLGIGLAIALRIVLLIVIQMVFETLNHSLFEIGGPIAEGAHDAASHTATAAAEATVNNNQPAAAPWLQWAPKVGSIVTLLGGGFILYTAIKEIHHMIGDHSLTDGDQKATRTVKGAVFWIVVMNLVFSFDSILSAIALTNGVGGFACRTATMAVAIVLSGLGMILLADTVSEFLKKNRMYEILGLFVLFIVGVMLITEGGHDSHLAFFGYAVEKMNKSTFYFVLAMLVLVDMAQSRYQKRLLAMAEAKRAAAEESVT